jgi:hypothetical protein
VLSLIIQLPPQAANATPDIGNLLLISIPYRLILTTLRKPAFSLEFLLQTVILNGRAVSSISYFVKKGNRSQTDAIRRKEAEWNHD